MAPEEKTLEQIQEEKIKAENESPVYTPEQIQIAKDMVESWREEAMKEVNIEQLKDFVNIWVLFKEDVISYMKEWTFKYLWSIITAVVTTPRLIKTNQEVILDLEKAISLTPEDAPEYNDLKATRMWTINQIKTFKADIENRKELTKEYETILSQLKEFISSL